MKARKSVRQRYADRYGADGPAVLSSRARVAAAVRWKDDAMIAAERERHREVVRAAERRASENRLRLHADLMRHLQAEGMDYEAASDWASWMIKNNVDWYVPPPRRS